MASSRPLRSLAPLVLLCLIVAFAACSKDNGGIDNPTPVVTHDTIPTPSRSGLVGYYTFNGNTDDSSGGYSGVVDRAVPTANRFGDSAGAYEFNGTTSKITVTMKTIFKDSLTIGAWVSTTAVKTQEIIRRSPSPIAPFDLALSGDGDIVFGISTLGQAPQVRRKGYPLNTWMFLVGTYDGSMMRLYINGVASDSMAVSGQIADYIDPLIIGSRLQLPADTFQGTIDDVVIYSRAITAAEVARLYALKKQ